MRMKMVCDDRTLREVANEFLALKKAQKVRERTLNDYKKYIDKFLEQRLTLLSRNVTLLRDIQKERRRIYMLQVALIYAFISFFQLIWHTIKHSMTMVGTNPCTLTVRQVQVEEIPKNKKMNLCKVTLDGYNGGTPVHAALQENIKKDDVPRFTEGQPYQMQYNSRNGKVYDPASGKAKIKSDAINLLVSIVIIVVCLLLLSVIS